MTETLTPSTGAPQHRTAPDHPAAAGSPSVRQLLRRHPLTSFFVLAFAISWLAWLPYVLSSSGLGVVDLDIPALLGTTQLVGVLPGAYLGPLTAAFVVTAVADGRAGLRAWGRRLVNWRVGWRWYVAVLLGVPGVIMLTTLQVPGAVSGAQAVGFGMLAVYLVVLVLQVVTTGLAEEPGWRDFALPRLQARRGPVVGTTILGLLWGAWHLPLFVTSWGGWPDVTLGRVSEFLVISVLLSYVMTWVFNRTGGSVPLIMLLHASINTTFSSVWPTVFPTLDWHVDSSRVLLNASAAAALVLLVATRGRLGYRAPGSREPAGDTPQR